MDKATSIDLALRRTEEMGRAMADAAASARVHGLRALDDVSYQTKQEMLMQACSDAVAARRHLEVIVGHAFFSAAAVERRVNEWRKEDHERVG